MVELGDDSGSLLPYKGIGHCCCDKQQQRRIYGVLQGHWYGLGRLPFQAAIFIVFHTITVLPA
jgi:hypothetical protein